ncbi:MAG: hypothetical protein M3277_04820 [Actinomycetota bacterium]|nr:hypothetical protein [Actinomycetota bacterium]
MKGHNVDLHDSYRAAAAALLAVFCAHVFALTITGPSVAATNPRRQRNALAAGRSAPRSHSVGVADNVESPVDLLSPYSGLGSWVDLFNRGPWRNPSWTVRRMDRRGVKTIYLQTATYGSPDHIVYPRKVAEFIASAHRRGMFVIGWSVPSFTRPKKDFRRARAAIDFRTAAGERFDSFGLDIEADLVDKIWKRNARLLDISRKLRRVAGPDYPLGAIIPDVHSRYWKNFPYKRLASIYDVMVPMGYFTFQARGYRHVRDYTAANIRVVRRQTGDPAMPVHVIGGIADDVGVAGARGFIRAVREHRAVGASLYDFPITSRRTWAELKAVPSRR